MSERGASIIPLSLVPSGVRDERQNALAQLFGEMLGAIDLSKLTMVDPLTVDARLLPILIRESGLSDFIEPGLNEESIRALLSRAYELHAGKGYVAGVRLGLELLGVHAEWVQWFEEEPKAAHNTHRVTVIFDKVLFNDLPVGDLRHRRAVARLISGLQRESQHIAVSFVIRARLQTRVGAHSSIGGVVRTLALKPTDQTERSRITLAAISRRGGVHHTKGLAA